MKLLSLLAAYIGLISVITGCFSTNDIENTKEVNKQPEVQEVITSDETTYTRAIKYMEVLNNNEIGENMMISPLSLEMALSLASNGMTDEAKAEMETLLGLSVTELNTQAKEFMDLVHTENSEASDAESDGYDFVKRQKLHIANSIWFKDVAEIRDNVNTEIIKIAQEQYSSDVGYFNESAKPINDWVSEHTAGNIPTVVTDETVKGSASIIVNAIHFEDAWRDKFNEESTVKHSFTLLDGKRVDCEMMFKHESDEVGYIDTDDVTGVSIPYNSDYNFIAVKLKDNTNISDLDLAEIIESITWEYDVTVGLPKFSCGYDTSMVEMLSDLGIEEIFKDGSMNNFLVEDSEIALTVGDIIQKTKIEVDEAGTKASAVTAIILETCSAVMEEPKTKEVIFDEPFLYFIVGKQSDNVLFIGTVSNPTLN